MARTTTALSPTCINLTTSSTKLTNFSFHHQFLHKTPIPIICHGHHVSLSHSPSLTHKANTTTTTSLLMCCYAYSHLDGSVGEEPDNIGEGFFDGDEVMIEDESEEEDDTESSVDLLIRFIQSLFKKVSKRAKKASRSILPAAISPQLLSFAVDGILVLASLSIVKALLEVVCTLGGTVFVVILLIRVIWAAISYFQSSGNSFNQGGSSFGTTQPVI